MTKAKPAAEPLPQATHSPETDLTRRHPFTRAHAAPPQKYTTRTPPVHHPLRALQQVAMVALPMARDTSLRRSGVVRVRHVIAWGATLW